MKSVRILVSLALVFSFSACSKQKDSKKVVHEKLAKAYPIVFKKPDGSGTLAQYKDSKLSLATIEKASKQIQDLKNRKSDFEIIVAYKTIAEKKLTDEMSNEELQVTFFAEKPKADFESLLKLVDFVPDARLKPTFVAEAPEPGLIAKVGEEKYFRKDLDLNHVTSLNLDQKIFDETMKQLAQVITYQEIKKAADAKGQTATQYLQENQLGDGQKASDQDVKDYLASINAREENIDEKTFEKFRTILTQRHQDVKIKKFVAETLIKQPISIFIEKPNLNLDMNSASTTFQGPDSSSVTMVLFSDMMCPDCQNLWNHIQETRAKYGDGIRFGFRHFFLSNDNFGRFVAEASQCVANQNQKSYWKFIERIQNENEAVTEEIINESVQFSGADIDKYKACMTARETKEKVQKELEYAQSLGLQKVPTLIVSGKTFYGKAPLEDIISVVKENYVKPQPKSFFSKIIGKIKAFLGLS